ncbi:MAG TPA: hypothetical protein VF613_15645 [Longimicrobium sp.]|jgi:hypothetical protein
MTMWRSLLLSLVLLALAAPAAHAFDYAEHCRMSNRAFRMAVSRALLSDSIAAPRREHLIALSDSTRAAKCVERVRDREGRRPPTHAYGEWVALVDWARTPADFFLTPFDTLSTRTDVIPADAIARLADLGLQDFVVLHDNSEHFAAHALYSYRLWHQRALDEAARGSIGVALIFNAFADHYLEDLQAPGHIFTPRSGLNDVLAGGMHNFYNRRGAFFFPRDVVALVPYLADPMGPVDSLMPRWSTVIDSACHETVVRDCVSGMEGDSIEMFGDHHVVRSARQELFITLMIARSVQDVLDAYVRQRPAVPVDHFANLRWCGYRRLPGDPGVQNWTSPTAQLPFGEMRQEDWKGLPNYQPWPYLRGGFSNDVRGGGYVELAYERLVKATAAGWLEPADAGVASQDKSTSWGYDLRVPFPWEPERSGIGVYRRAGTSYNRVNARVTKIAGGRVQPFHRAIEPYLGLSGELGFSVLHVEIRPSVHWNSRNGFTGTVFSGVSFFVPNTNTALPARRQPVPKRPPATLPCRDGSPNSITIP